MKSLRISNDSWRIGVGPLVVAGAFLAPGGPAFAQEVLDEIIVTATKRELNLQDVPVAVSVIDASELLGQGGTNYRDYLTSVPGVALVDMGGIANRVILRSLATAADPETGSPTVVTYFDEIPVGGGLGAINIEPLDLARVEVLRGPQGTLYGAGSVGGTLRFIPNNPKPGEFQGFANASLADRDGADGQDYNVQGGVNLPLGQAAAIRVAGYYKEDAEFVTNLRTGLEVGGIEQYGGRISALVNLGERTQVVARYLYSEADTDDEGLRLFGTPGEVTTEQFDQPRERETQIATLTLTHDFGGASLTAASGYVDNSNFQLRDLTVAIGVPSLIDIQNEGQIFTQELRLASTGEDNALDWLVGAYYSDSDVEANIDLTVIAPPSFPIVQTRTNAEQSAVFGQLDWHFAERWTLTVGGRYADYSSDLQNVLSVTTAESSDSTFNPSASLQYQSGQGLYYLQAAKGFRPGAGQTFPAQPTDVCRALAEATIPSEFTSDELWNYELGAKWSLGDVGTLNAAVFYIDWEEVPILLNFFPPAPCIPGVYTENVGTGEVMGAEIEMVLRPVEGLTLAGSLAYSETELVDSGGRFAFDEGRPLPASPELNASLTVSYDFPVGERWTATLGGQVQYIDSYNFYLETDFWEFCSFACPAYVGAAPGDVPQPPVGGYTQVNLNAGLASERFSVNLFVNNLFNEDEVTGLFINGATTDLLASSLRSRTIGVAVGVNF